jgi:hypothetical protein
LPCLLSFRFLQLTDGANSSKFRAQTGAITVSYDLHAFIGGHSLLESQFRSFNHAKVVPLLQAELSLVPMTSKLQEELEARGGTAQHLNDFSIFDRLTPAVADWIISLPHNDAIAYVEAEFFGGMGGHCAVVWRRGQCVFGPVRTRVGQPGVALNVKSPHEMAINQALVMLGVTKSGHHDEFAAVGLGRNRSTDNW